MKIFDFTEESYTIMWHRPQAVSIDDASASQLLRGLLHYAVQAKWNKH
jgi:hypothetical protein